MSLAQQVRLANGGRRTTSPFIRRADGAVSWPALPGPESRSTAVAGTRSDYDLEFAWTDWPDAMSGARPAAVAARTENVDGRKETFSTLSSLRWDLEVCNRSAANSPSASRTTRGWCFATMATTRTLAAQLWLRPQTDELGWPDLQTAMTAFEKPADKWQEAALNTWEDNTRLLQWETPRERQARSLAYLVNILPDDGAISRARTQPGLCRAGARQSERGPSLMGWRRARGSSGPGSAGSCSRRRTTRKVRPVSITNSASPTSTPGTATSFPCPAAWQHRLWPDGLGIINLFLAGDWVRSGVNAGCLEAAVIGGRMAARAITEGDMAIPGDGNFGSFFRCRSGLCRSCRRTDRFKTAASGGVGKIEAYCCDHLGRPRSGRSVCCRPGSDLFRRATGRGSTQSF